MNNNITELMETVVKNEYCIGCGACAIFKESNLRMILDDNGKYKPSIKDTNLNDNNGINVLNVCPFSNNCKNETEIGKIYFENVKGINYNEYIGYYLNNYAGYVKEGDFREKGSSGGMANWIATQLLKLNLVDGIIHVKSTKRDKNKKILFEYQVSYDMNELSVGSKSKYYPIEMSKVIKEVKEKKGRYALIGIPCFIKAIRLMSDYDDDIRQSIKFTIGLVCGHLKSDMFAKSMGWQLGIHPDKLSDIDFRKKIENKASSNYAVEVTGIKDGETISLISPTRNLYTTNWGHGLFKYNACDYCDDVLAETADITVGDAWLPEYVNDSQGTNIIIVRNPLIQKILDDNIGNLFLNKISADKIYQSQAGGFRHRREGLAYRLSLKDKEDLWRPVKRFEVVPKLNMKRKKIYKKRIILIKESFKAYKLALDKDDFNVFVNYMNPIIKDYDKTIKTPVIRRTLSKIKRILSKIFRRLT